MKKNLIRVLLIATTLTEASELDLGIGFSGLSYPDYVGSSHQNNIIIPYPYIYYRSDKLQIDNEGLQRKLFSINDLTLKLSLSGTLPVESRGAREGMDDLDAAGEIGPSLLYNLYKNDAFYIKDHLWL